MKVSVSHPGVITRFLWFCSGADPDILQACPRSEHIKFAGIGGTVFFTGLLATLSGGYAFYTVFENIFIALLFGLLWGLIIFNLDRFIVSTIKKEGGLGRQFSLAIPRILLAAVLAIVIAKPLELRVFRGEIDEVLTQQRVDKGAAAGAGYEVKSKELEARIVSLQDLTNARFQQREQDYQDYKCECDGTCGTGQMGRGSECSRKEEKYLLSNKEYQETKATNDVEAARLRREVEGLVTQTADAKKLADDTFSTGLLARLSASNELPWGPGFFLVLMLALIEISPILSKILAPRGPYDEILARVEQEFYLRQRKKLEEEKLNLNKEVSLLNGLHEAEISEKVKQKQLTLRAVADARLELVQDQIDAWLEEEKDRLEAEKGHFSNDQP